MFDIIGKRFWYFLISGIVILSGIIALSLFHLSPGIDFRGGTELNITFKQTVDTQQVIDTLASLGYTGSNTVVLHGRGNDYTIDLPDITLDAKAAVLTGLTAKLGEYTSGRFQSVAPKAAANTTTNATIAVIISAIGMLLYISWAFHRMPNPFRWGVCAIAALVHDVLVVLGTFAIFSALFGWQVDLMFIAAVLTVIGYSVNDTIVVFDRIRENLSRNPGMDFEMVVNNSLVQTMSRTLITGVGTLFTLIALVIIVGAPVQNLIMVLLVGIITGTYSAIGTAASLLVVWRKGEWGRFIGRRALSTAKING
ncbi:MAG: Protein-export rane protein SecF [Dehalococcoidales bacterium]|nr:Protein-export rane protein SecF [Dehalococcoidales bacterium]